MVTIREAPSGSAGRLTSAAAVREAGSDGRGWGARMHPGQTDQTRWTVSSRRVHPLWGTSRHLCEITRGHVRPSDVHTAHRRCSPRSVVPEPHEEEEEVLQHQRASEGTWHRQRNPASRQSGKVVISQRRRAEAELMKETVSGPHSESMVLFMNGSGWHAAIMDSGGDPRSLSVWWEKPRLAVCSLRPSLCGGLQGSGEWV